MSEFHKFCEFSDFGEFQLIYVIFQIADARVLGYKEGQTILVKYYGNDPASGQVRLSRKVLTIAAASAVKNLRSAKKEHVTEPKSTQGFVDYKR